MITKQSFKNSFLSVYVTMDEGVENWAGLRVHIWPEEVAGVEVLRVQKVFP